MTAQMELETDSGQVSSWLRWSKKSAVALALGMGVFSLISFAIAYQAEQITGRDDSLYNLLGHIVALAAGGALMGALQRRLLPAPLRSSRGWVVAGAVGFAVGWIAGGVASCLLTGGPNPRYGTCYPHDYTLGWTTALLLAAIIQWSGLRKHVPAAGWWVVANVAGYGLGFLLAVYGLGVPLADGVALQPDFQSPVLEGFMRLAADVAQGLIAGLVGGAVTGAVWFWLFKQNQPASRGESSHANRTIRAR